MEILIHHLAFKVPDKAEFRQKASSAIVELTLGLPQEYFSRIVRYSVLYIMERNFINIELSNLVKNQQYHVFLYIQVVLSIGTQ